MCYSFIKITNLNIIMDEKGAVAEDGEGRVFWSLC